MKNTSWGTWLATGLIAAATAAAFGNSFGGPFIFDDGPSIPENSTIRRLWPVWKPFCPPNDGQTVTGRPLLNFSFAVNYALGGTDPRGYHLVNLLIHIAAALTLFGLLRRTLTLPTMCDRWGAAAAPLAAFVALIWAVHPLQTESVTYIVQRAESLAGLFYLLTLYGLLRGAESERGAFWHCVSALACLLGMATKEVMVTAPFIALLYDRTFLAGSFREALRRRYGLYLAFAVALAFMENLAYHAGLRGSSAGFGLGVTPWSYLLMQCQAVVYYLKLCAWPNPLVLDYGNALPPITPPLLPSAIAMASLGLLTLLALWRRPKLGFLGACFLAILAPSSSAVPVATQTMTAHRMYLPLAVVVMAVAAGCYAGLTALARRKRPSASAVIVAGIVSIAAAIALAMATYNRNKDYRDELTIWTDNADKAPYNSRAWVNLGAALEHRGECEEAMALYKKALDIDNANGAANCNYYRVRESLVQLDQRIARGRKDAVAQPDSAEARRKLAWLLATSPAASRRNAEEAERHALRAVQLAGGKDPDALDALAAAHAEAGRFSEALDSARKALELAEGQNKTNLADALRGRIALYESGKPFRGKLPEISFITIQQTEVEP